MRPKKAGSLRLPRRADGGPVVGQGGLVGMTGQFCNWHFSDNRTLRGIGQLPGVKRTIIGGFDRLSLDPKLTSVLQPRATSALRRPIVGLARVSQSFVLYDASYQWAQKRSLWSARRASG
jgi:hypothetical protein